MNPVSIDPAMIFFGSRFGWLAATMALVLSTTSSWAMIGGPRVIVFSPGSDRMPLVSAGRSAPLVVGDDEFPGVRRAAGDVAADIGRVTGIAAALVSPAAMTDAPTAIIAGTLGRSALVDDLVRAGKLDVSAVVGRWEAFLIQVVDRPLPGVDRALVVVGSDRRGTIFGLYELSEQMGVSPWYWWGDVPVTHRDALYALTTRVVEPGPRVKYRGLFLNDEAPALTNWVRAKFGDAPVRSDPPVPAGVANYGREFYSRMFEVMLRLRANYLWPAMWANAFNEDDPANAALADEFGIVMGTSHQEPMLRAQKEWDRRFEAKLGHWNYAKQPEVLEQFWRDGIRRNKSYESLVTIGLRGANDTEMAPGGPEANRALLEKIVDVQRDILRQEVNPDVTKVPQLWCLYKEVQEFYEHGLRVPDDVTLLWAEDNWGNVRRVPTATERQRSGGAGIYYHFDYHGGPRSYQWINTSPIAKIQEQMSLAAHYGADRVWIVNAGHFKGYEFPLEYFLTLAWSPEKWATVDVTAYTREWAVREFGLARAADIADVIARTTKFNGRRKPEMLAPGTYSLVDYREAETVVAEFNTVVARAEAIARELPAASQEAFYGLVLFPAKAAALVNELYVAGGRNALYAKQGRASAGEWAATTRRLFEADLALMDHFNREFAGGKWNHFMDQTHLGYLNWRDPAVNSLRAIPLVEPVVAASGALGVAVEGSKASWPAAVDAAEIPEAVLPRFDALNRQRRYLEVFNRGREPLPWSMTTSAPWIKPSETTGELAADRRVWIELDWAAVPAGESNGYVNISGGGREVRVRVDALNPPDASRETVRGFVENAGVISIEPEHFDSATTDGARQWRRIEDYGRTLSGLRAEAPVDAAPADPAQGAPCVSYEVHVFGAGTAEVTAITAPTLNFLPDRPLRYAVSFDDAPPRIITLVPAGYQARNGNIDWEKTVGDNARYSRSRHTLARPGRHTLKLWMVDPGVVLQKLVVDLGGLKPSYLGPPESLRLVGQEGRSTVGPGLPSSRVSPTSR